MMYYCTAAQTMPGEVQYGGITGSCFGFERLMLEKRRESQSEKTTGNIAALENLYEEYFPKLVRYAYVRIGNRVDAEDIAGDVFLKAFKAVKSFKDRGIPIQAWIFKIAHNVVVDYWREKGKHKTVSIEDIELQSGNDPAKIAEQNIQIEMVKNAMQDLTDDQREVVALRFFGGLTSKETGKIMNKREGAVREMQRAAIEKLRKLLATG